MTEDFMPRHDYRSIFSDFYWVHFIRLIHLIEEGEIKKKKMARYNPLIHNRQSIRL